MELKEMTVEQLEERMAAIPAELDNEEADLDALEAEARSIKEELEARKAEEAQKAEIRSAVAAGQGVVVETVKTEERKEMNEVEIRNSQEYINAFAEFNDVYAKYFTGRPARSCVAVAALPKGALVEVEVIAKEK